MMIRPFRQLEPGDRVSAAEFNRLAAEVERLQRMLVTPPLQLDTGVTGQKLSINQRGGIWVKITGKKLTTDPIESGASSGNYVDTNSGSASCPCSGSGMIVGSGSSSGCYPPNHYSGEQVTDSLCSGSGFILQGGLKFYVDTFPLKEIEGNVSVSAGSIVKAYPSDNGAYYTFKFASSSVSSGGAADCRILSGILTENNGSYTVGPAQPFPGNAYAYFAVIQDNPDVWGFPPDTLTYVWLVPYYQDNWSLITATVHNVQLTMGLAYIAVPVNATYIAGIKTNPDDDPIIMSLPVYVTTYSPGRLACQDGDETIISGTS